MASKAEPPNPDPADGFAIAEPYDPNHHLWRNGRLWWVAFTIHLPGWQKERIRLSLRTADLLEARRRRDEVLRTYPQHRKCRLSLRLQPPRATARPEMRPFAA